MINFLHDRFVHMHLDNTKLVIPVSVNVSRLPLDSSREPSLKPSTTPLKLSPQNNVTVGETDLLMHWPHLVDFGTLGVIDSQRRVPVYMTHLYGPSVMRLMSARVDSSDNYHYKNNITVHLVRTTLDPPKVKSSKICSKDELKCMATVLGSETTDDEEDKLLLRTQYLDQVVGPYKQLIAYVDFELIASVSGVVSGNISFTLVMDKEVSEPSVTPPVVVSIPFRSTLLLGGVGFSDKATQFLLPVSNRTYFPHPFDSSYQSVPGNNINEKNGKPFCGIMKNEDQKKLLDKKGKSKSKGKSKGEKSTPVLLPDDNSNCVKNGRGDCVGNADKPIYLSLTNYYNQPLLLVDAQVLSCGSETGSPLFKVTRIDRSVVAKGGESWPALELEFDLQAALLFQEKSPRELPFICYLLLSTSVSEHRLPLYITDGSVRLVHVNAVSIYLHLYLYLYV